MNKSALFKISYGLYIISSRLQNKDNGCIINTVTQVTDNPLRLTATLGKDAYTHDMILNNKEFNISILSESAPFSLFEIFGFKSGRDINKFSNVNFGRSSNGITYLKDGTSSYISCKTIDIIDLGTHSLILADILDAEAISNEKPMTYAYYRRYVKPKPKKSEKGAWRCEVCGYMYQGENLPEDFICPWCKHGASSFTKV